MNEIFIIALLAIIDLILGVVLGFFLTRFILNREGTTLLLEAEERSKEIISEAKEQADKEKIIRLRAVNDEWMKKKKEFEFDSQIKQDKLNRSQKENKAKEESLAKENSSLQERAKIIESTEKILQAKKQELEQKSKELTLIMQAQNKILSQVSNINEEEAKEMLMENLLKEAKKNSEELITSIKNEAIAKSEIESRKILFNAVEKLTDEHFSDNSVIFVSLKSDDLKGKIIGKEGRNIKSFQSITGVDLIVDDTPEIVILSSFDPIRREIAKMTLEKLLVDGIIHPALIEKKYNEVLDSFDDYIFKIGEDAAISLDVGQLDRSIVKKVGMMRFHSTYGQNLLEHSKETARIAGALAAEIKLDARLARRAGLLHDIGKLVKNAESSHEVEGQKLLSEFNEDPTVLNAIGSHHNKIEKTNPISEIVSLANELSATRINVRGVVVENEQIKRLQSLEEIARSFPGVSKSYAIDSGRQISVIVDSSEVNDTDAAFLAKEISKKISDTAKFSGKIKVSVIRETQNVSIAQGK